MKIANKKIAEIIPLGKLPVYDITVDEAEHYILENGVVTHNTKLYLAADNIYIIGRQQDKTGKEITGFNFIINVEKSRHVREKVKIPVTINFDDGIDKWSGLFDIAVEGGFITRLNNVSYGVTDPNTGEVVRDKLKRSEIENDTKFWNWLFDNTRFKEYIKEEFKTSSGVLIREGNEELDVEVVIIDESEID